MTTMIEKVARALRDKNPQRIGIVNFDAMTDRNKDYWRMNARIAIEAMRDSIGSMYIAGARAIPDGAETYEGLLDHLGLCLAWKAMIDAALNEKDS